MFMFKGNETPAYILGALTASGGTLGYVRTGSVPSIAAGLTVGSLVCVLTTVKAVDDTYLTDATNNQSSTSSADTASKTNNPTVLSLPYSHPWFWQGLPSPELSEARSLCQLA
jgi:hypothetical protein